MVVIGTTVSFIRIPLSGINFPRLIWQIALLIVGVKNMTKRHSPPVNKSLNDVFHIPFHIPINPPISEKPIITKNMILKIIWKSIELSASIKHLPQNLFLHIYNISCV